MVRMSQVNPSQHAEVVDGRSTRWDDHRADRRELILAAAIRGIDEVGPGIGVQDIAARAGIPRSVVYRIFKDRDDLDDQIRARIVENLMVDMGPTLALEGSIAASIRRAVQTYVTWIVEHPKLHQFIGRRASGGSAAKGHVATRKKREIARTVTSLIEAFAGSYGIDAKFAESLAFGLVGFVDASVNRWLSSPVKTLTADELREFLEQSIWDTFQGALRRGGLDIDANTPVTAVIP